MRSLQPLLSLMMCSLTHPPTDPPTHMHAAGAMTCAVRSAVVAGLCGGPGVCPGANIGQNVAIFEQVTYPHSFYPRYSSKPLDHHLRLIHSCPSCLLASEAGFTKFHHLKSLRAGREARGGGHRGQGRRGPPGHAAQHLHDAAPPPAARLLRHVRCNMTKSCPDTQQHLGVHAYAFACA